MLPQSDCTIRFNINERQSVKLQVSKFCRLKLDIDQRRAGREIKILWKSVCACTHVCLNRMRTWGQFATRLCNRSWQSAPTQEQQEIGNYFSWDWQWTFDELSAPVHLALKSRASERQLVKTPCETPPKNERSEIEKSTWAIRESRQYCQEQ